MQTAVETARTQPVTRLVIHNVMGESRVVTLSGQRITLGRSSTCQLSYPDDIGLSRQHLAFQPVGDGWQVEDLGSKNGTLLNGVALSRPTPMVLGDRLQAGHLTIIVDGSIDSSGTGIVSFDSGRHKTRPTGVEFVEPAETEQPGMFTTEAAKLEAALKPQGPTDSPQVQALIRAGRELAGHRPLHELFEVIMDLAMNAVRAGRGVLMTLESGELIVRAARGAGFKISSMVRDRVLNDKTSLLVRDAQMDAALRAQQSIVLQRVRSFMAVPLQTNDQVIGLIYVDSPDLIREFTREDLGLLTVMANVAAIRIEHARLNEIEAIERSMAKELEQAAQIQAGLLPASAPTVDGWDLAGSTLASLTVGGDYFDYLPFPDGRVAVIVGDVAGKGLPAALLVASLQARSEVLFDSGDDLKAKVERLNRATAAHCPDNRFITFFLGVIDPMTGGVHYVNAGHNPPLVLRAGAASHTSDAERLEAGGVMLGILPMAQFQEGGTTLNTGDVIVMFSDGVTEATNAEGEDFGEERVIKLVRSMRDRSAADIVAAIQQAVAQFAHGLPQADDITVVVAKRAAPPDTYPTQSLASALN